MTLKSSGIDKSLFFALRECPQDIIAANEKEVIYQYYRSFQRERDKYFNWEAAEELCKATRDHKEAIPVRVYVGSRFKPNVVEYMKRKG
ncbi:hypothetical protein DJ93_156 [Bacillus clarus]|uniref:Uncharacterized protein n=1 Tax=Bacillus clarus TaxID=2338372 RepID=A0A090YXQ1_9BACI|nr:hypothetical protein DJ93_156 [Bacillus clarus]